MTRFPSNLAYEQVVESTHGEAGGEEDRYHLSAEALERLESSMLNQFKETHPEESGVVVLAVPQNSEYANIARTFETKKFHGYDSATAMLPYEEKSLFVYTVNLDKPATSTGSHIGHIKRLVFARDANPLMAETLGTGLEVVDDRLVATTEEEGCELADIAQVHGINDFSKCINVTSNMETEEVIASLENPYTLISYKAVFEIGKELGATHLFAYINPEAHRSLSKRLGVRADLLANGNFHLPDPNRPGEYFDDYLAYSLPYDTWNMAAFTELHPDYRMRKLIANREVKVFYY